MTIINLIPSDLWDDGPLFLWIICNHSSQQCGLHWIGETQNLLIHPITIQWQCM